MLVELKGAVSVQDLSGVVSKASPNKTGVGVARKIASVELVMSFLYSKTNLMVSFPAKDSAN